MSEYVYFKSKSYLVGSADLDQVVQSIVSDGTSASDIVFRAKREVPKRFGDGSLHSEKAHQDDLYSYVENERYLISTNASSRLNVNYSLGDVAGDIFIIVFLTCLFIIPLAVYILRSLGGADATTEIVIIALVIASGLYFSSRKIAGTAQTKLIAAYREGMIDEGNLQLIQNYKQALYLINKNR